MAQNEKILAGVLEIFRHNPQKQYRVDQIEREARRERLGNFTELIKALSFLEHEKKIITDRMCFDDEYCSSCLFINKSVYRSKAGNYEYG